MSALLRETCRHPASRLAMLTAALAIVSLGCGSGSTSVMEPSGPKCQVTVANSLESVPASGATGTLTVSTARDCTWAVSSNAGWLTVLSGSSGQGNGTSSYRVAANTTADSRRVTLAVNDTTLTIVQAAACAFAVTPSDVSAPAQGASREVRVTTADTCEWATATEVDWLRLDGGGAGSRTIVLTVAPNLGAPRSARAVVAGEAITVTQAGAAVPECRYTIDPIGQTVGAAGASVDVSVTAAPGCAWTAASNAAWIGVARNATGSGASVVSLSVSANPAASRTGTATIAGQLFTVTQPAVACTYQLAPAGQSLPATAGTGTVTVTTGSGCAWTATSSAAWLTVTSGTSGAGTGTVGFAVAANSGPARAGTLTVGGQAFIVTQAQAPAVITCTYELRPVRQTLTNAGGTGTFDVIAAPGCAWTARSSAGWITITSATSGSGNGAVTFRVDARNGGNGRTGTILVADQTFTLTQGTP